MKLQVEQAKEHIGVLCQDDCKGLCVHCGANLNVSPCSCESFVVDPRFAELRALLDEKDDRLS